MKVFKFIAKYALIFIVVSVITVLAAIGGVAYYALNNLHTEAKTNQNLVDVMKIGENYVAELESFENLQRQLQNKKMPPFCKTLCNPTELDQDALLNERTPYLTQFYKASGHRALQDPMFRFKLEQMSSVSRAVPPSVRDLMKDILNPQTFESQNKALLAIKVETALLMNLPSAQSRLDSFKSDNDKLSMARDWIKACQKGANSKKITADCEAEFASSN
ncbi:hypothetical protein [Bdellovibrio sp. HCB209]|uniref:CHASE3 domain-containing protein n=1 Tax=Bdellovibrio sp. HCB209 TaxID=3394354 RepID=UPI0039B58CBF